MSQFQGPTLINLPPSGSETPSEAPGTPTSTTTSLSTLSTTAIKDGHRGHHRQSNPVGRTHGHNPSTTSLEAERADRISRLAGLERIAALRAIPQTQHAYQQSTSSHNPASTTSATASVSPQVASASPSGFPLNYPPNTSLTPAYFDSQGQPVAGPTKMSTVGTASATTRSTHRGEDSDDVRTTTEDQDEDMLSATDTASMSHMLPADGLMDEDTDGIGPRSVSGFEDRMSDDGSASLVGFGEGAGSTVSGPIYQRRPLPQLAAQGSNAGSAVAGGSWNLERQASGLSDMMPGLRRDKEAFTGSDTSISAAALQERREARMMDGVAQDSAGVPPDEMFVDTTTRSPVPNMQLAQHNVHGSLHPSSFGQAIRAHPQQPRTPIHHQQVQASAPSSASRDAERIIQGFDGGDVRAAPAGSAAMGNTGLPGERLGRFYFEDGRI